MNNLHAKPASLRFVSMPIVELMRSIELSWADKEACADALIRIRRHHESMVDEAKDALPGVAQGAKVQDRESMPRGIQNLTGGIVGHAP